MTDDEHEDPCPGCGIEPIDPLLGPFLARIGEAIGRAVHGDENATFFTDQPCEVEVVPGDLPNTIVVKGVFGRRQLLAFVGRQAGELRAMGFAVPLEIPDCAELKDDLRFEWIQVDFTLTPTGATEVGIPRPLGVFEETWHTLSPLTQRRLNAGRLGLDTARVGGSRKVVVDGVRALQSTDRIGTDEEQARVQAAHDEMQTYLARRTT